MRKVNIIKGKQILPKFIGHRTNIWVSADTRCRPGYLRCPGSPAWRSPSNPVASKDRLGCLTGRRSRGGPPPGQPHLETQYLQTCTNWKMIICWALRDSGYRFRLIKRNFFKDFLSKKSIKQNKKQSSEI